MAQAKFWTQIVSAVGSAILGSRKPDKPVSGRDSTNFRMDRYDAERNRQIELEDRRYKEKAFGHFSKYKPGFVQDNFQYTDPNQIQLIDPTGKDPQISGLLNSPKPKPRGK